MKDGCTDLDEMLSEIAKLEKENAVLKEINTHILSQLNLDNGGLIIENEKLKKENAELKKDNEGYEKDNARLVQQYNDLQKENAELKIELSENKVADCHIVNGLCEQLTNAKDLLKWALHSDPEHDEDFEKKWEQSEQFLKEAGK